jgi:hypothetical protein
VVVCGSRQAPSWHEGFPDWSHLSGDPALPTDAYSLTAYISKVQKADITGTYNGNNGSGNRLQTP